MSTLPRNLFFMYYFCNGEKCGNCGDIPLYKVGEDPLCSKCFDKYMDNKDEDHEGMIQRYDGSWGWL